MSNTCNKTETHIVYLAPTLLTKHDHT